MNLIDYIENIAKDDYELREMIVEFLSHNKWFGYKPVLANNRTVYIDDKFLTENGSVIEKFIKENKVDDNERLNKSLNQLANSLPVTANIFEEFLSSSIREIDNISTLNKHFIASFLLNNLKTEIIEIDNDEAKALVENSLSYLNIKNVNILCRFLIFTKQYYRTKFTYDFEIEKEILKDNDAYDIDEYCRIMYHMFHPEYIDANNMYYKAANSKGYIDTWLFISLHFICALRNSDLIRLPHPELPYEPEKVLEDIANDNFPKDKALFVLRTFIENIGNRKPNKTKEYNVSNIKFFTPKSTEEHIGKLLAIAESWYQIEESTGPLIKVITHYKDICANMGEEIGSLFLDSNFHSRKANKSYMQAIEILTDSVIGVNEDFNIKGYMLASLARSHSGSYGEFAQTTIKYLKDQKMTGYSPDFVARELFERGVLSFIPKMLLSIVTERESDKFDIHTQTRMLEQFSLSPLETEQTVAISEDVSKQANELIINLVTSKNRTAILDVVHKIANGEAVSKNDGTFCLLSACKLPCAKPINRNCSVCEFDILTKETLFKLINEKDRLLSLYKESDNPLEKEKIRQSAKIIATKLDEMFTCYREMYGEEDFIILKKVLKELKDEKDKCKSQQLQY